MENKQSYFGEIGAAFKTLTTGLKTTMKRSTSLPSQLSSIRKTVRQRCMWPNAIVAASCLSVTKTRIISVLLA